MLRRRILPSITTMTPGGWSKKLNEIEPLGLQQIALFVTGLSREERRECFTRLAELQRQHFFTVPFVHAVSSMTAAEYVFCCEQFGTEAFNLHSQEEYPLEHPLGIQVRRRIFIENTRIDAPIPLKDLGEFGGICFDISHLEDTRRSCPANYRDLLRLSRDFVVGANHISAVGRVARESRQGLMHYSKHVADTQDELLYPAQLSSSAFALLCAVELENSLAEQLALIPTIRSAMAEAETRESTGWGEAARSTP